MFGPGSKSEVVEDMAEVVGELGASRGGGSRSTSEPDVCRALTGVAKGALPERGELRSGRGVLLGVVGAGGREGKSCRGHLKGLGWKGVNPRQGRGGGIGPEGLNLSAAGILSYLCLQ